ncbi:NAD-dependent deacetylase, SIR2-like protein [Lacticaseibacillus rhamnosus MTCC 5462]|nr:NAD-dependent deacetylase, SIR2-like protein [Lacticaseibacillus rhamnosus MTCC 5462]
MEDQNIPKCRICGGLIIPDFVYRDLRTYPNEVANGEKMIESADLLLILGTRRQASSFPSTIKRLLLVNRLPQKMVCLRLIKI